MARNNRLLIVDDDPLNTRTLCEIFTANGYEAQAALSGEEALKMLKADHFCCVLSDIRMPRMNGVELLRAVNGLKRHTIFILMTAYSDQDLILQGIREGALVTLNKPLDIDRLLAYLDGFLKNQVPPE